MVINVLDTPGHQDFCEDTYRTLTAADSAIMVIDAAKGVEVQTRKLFEVCRLRKIPVFTLINKMDLPGRPPLDLMAEVEDVLGIHASAVNWPVGSGQRFVGVVDRISKQVSLFKKMAAGGSAKASRTEISLDSPEAKSLLEEDLFAQVHHDLELLESAYALIREQNVSTDKFEFQVLYGVPMSGWLENHLKNNFKVRVYVPFGVDWYAYSIRRLKENANIARYILKDFFRR